MIKRPPNLLFILAFVSQALPLLLGLNGPPCSAAQMEGEKPPVLQLAATTTAAMAVRLGPLSPDVAPLSASSTSADGFQRFRSAPTSFPVATVAVVAPGRGAGLRDLSRADRLRLMEQKLAANSERLQASGRIANTPGYRFQTS